MHTQLTHPRAFRSGEARLSFNSADGDGQGEELAAAIDSIDLESVKISSPKAAKDSERLRRMKRKVHQLGTAAAASPLS